MLKHQQLLFHETYRLGDPNHAQPIIRGFWGNWYQVMNHTYSNCCWWNPGWNSNVSWLNQSSNMIHFDIPCFLVFPWTFYPWISWWTLHIFPKKQKQSHLWMKCGWNVDEIPNFESMKCYEMPWNAPKPPKLPSSSPKAPPGVFAAPYVPRDRSPRPAARGASPGSKRLRPLRWPALCRRPAAFHGALPMGSHGILKGKPWKNHGKTWENHWFFCDISGFPAFVSIQFEENMWNQGTWGFHLTCS